MVRCLCLQVPLRPALLFEDHVVSVFASGEAASNLTRWQPLLIERGHRNPSAWTHAGHQCQLLSAGLRIAIAIVAPGADEGAPEQRV